MFRFIATFLTAATIAAAGGDNDARIAAMFAAAKSATYAARPFTEPMSLKAGQWVTYGITDDDGDRTVMTTRIISVTDGEVVMEHEMILEDDVLITQFRIKGMEAARRAGSLDDIEFVGVKIKENDGEVMEIDRMVLSMAGGMYKKSLKGMAAKPTITGDGGSQRVAAGTFSGTTKMTSDVALNGTDEESIAFAHPDVPIYGIVKSTTGDEFTMELLDFGTTGAKSAID